MELSLGIDRIVLITAALLVLAVLVAAFAARLGDRLRVPSALLLLGLGMAIGVDGAGLIDLNDASLVRDLGALALLLILFEGGLTTKPTDLRMAAVPGTLLATVGVALTAVVTGAGVWLLFGIDPKIALLLGAVVASTDAAAVFSMMRTTVLPRRVAAVLRLESGANDPIAVMLTVGLIASLESAPSAGQWVSFAALQLIGGAVVGLVVGWLGAVLLRHVELGVEGLYPVLAAGFAALAYGIAAAIGASGFVAVYLAGLLIGALVPRHRRAVLGFHEAAANAAEIGLFLLLGLLVVPSRLLDVAPQSLAVAAVLTLVARPAAVWLCSLGSRLGWREKVVISWAGLRGAVPIVLATFPFTAGVEGGAVLFDVVFFVVLLSVLVQGLSLPAVVRRLGLSASRPAWSPLAEAFPLDGIDIDLIEVHVSEDLPIAGCALRDLPSLGAILVTAVVRGERVLVPTGTTEVLPGDVLLLAAQRQGDVTAQLSAWAQGHPCETPDAAAPSEAAATAVDPADPTGPADADPADAADPAAPGSAAQASPPTRD